MLDIHPKLKPAVGTVIVLHGWGANSHDVELLAEALRLPSFRYIIPEGRYDVPGTGGRGKGWYSLPLDAKSEKERQTSKKQLFNILDDLDRKGTSADTVVFLGFSQGASMGLDVMLDYKKPIAGVVSLSGFLLDSDKIRKRSNLPAEIPVFAGHGTLDPLIPLDQGKSSIMSLKTVGFEVEWHEYPAEHRVVIEELEDVRKFLAKLFNF